MTNTVKAQVVISKIHDGERMHKKGDIIEVPLEWAVARGTSVKILTAPETPPYLPPEEEPVEEITIEDPVQEEPVVQEKPKTPAKKTAKKSVIRNRK
jgi:hypothetical protein